MINLDGYRAAREAAVLYDRSARGKIAVAGSDRRSYLHAMLTNDIEPLQPGTGCYAAYLTAQGRMISDMRVLELGDLVLLDLPPDQVQPVMEKLDQFVFSEDVKFGDLTQAFAEVGVAGPDAARVVFATLAGGIAGGAATVEELAGWMEYRNARATFQGEMVLVVASHESGVPGFDLYIERPHAARLAASLAAAGAVLIDDEGVETLRIEAGRPKFGAELASDTIPLEAGIEDRAISFTKGCYPGQEVVIRVVHRGRGRVARRLLGLRIEGGTVPAPGSQLRAIVESGGTGKEAGRVTSAAWSPSLEAPIALAYVQRDFTAPGTRLHVEHGGELLAATVSSVPFL